MSVPQMKRRKIQHDYYKDSVVCNKNTRTTITTTRLAFDFTSPHTPLILSSYAGLIFYTILIGSLLVLLYLGLTSVQQEIHERIAEHSRELEYSVAQCRQKYQGNHCQDKVKFPFLVTYCNAWLKCMQQNTRVVKRADIGARVFGELINSFFDALTLKTMVALSLLMFGPILFLYIL
ncbi:Di-sulfide bridge nucleocytoplasmic transport domain-containing protein [Halteromyces radiatus]|uniref:Di-sulfide bridge nucleocytoplasmic transport domain-containing protein n=1 Tax=Halteromyces radiatus TaxID=101107 RepID=UPI0022204622|nr:Di-sulfide bridge nucleocytoplasmic transport domain-containing protein [Halteromyces radiatus]KAI8093142.1 Di-sulfide bridge nucleocytoplasmic transport domain-containing protein [Halteromyces radiatus]